MFTTPDTVHIHIGVDRVFENLFSFAICEDVLSFLDKSVHIFSTKEYAHYLQKPIDIGTGVAVSEVMKDATILANTVVISRPRFLFPGGPMNVAQDYKKSFYKLKSIENMFSGSKVVFHILLTDHLSYLTNKKLKVVGDVERYSWIPFVDSVQGAISDESRLCVWGAESPKQTAANLIANILEIDLAEAEFTSERCLNWKKFKVPNSNEAPDKETSNHILDLDVAFEKDISYFETRPYQFVNSGF